MSAEDHETEPHVHGPNCNHAKAAPAVRAERPGRNEACWCGSGKTYEKWHPAEDSG